MVDSSDDDFFFCQICGNDVPKQNRIMHQMMHARKERKEKDATSLNGPSKKKPKKTNYMRVRPSAPKKQDRKPKESTLKKPKKPRTRTKNSAKEKMKKKQEEQPHCSRDQVIVISDSEDEDSFANTASRQASKRVFQETIQISSSSEEENYEPGPLMGRCWCCWTRDATYVTRCCRKMILCEDCRQVLYACRDLRFCVRCRSRYF
ncbi:Oidioi.mRNA.OKI2018_I69.chr1.g2976.t1.cds [Oikopleura dioica]|uniref:Oidioi.mRNA.OKI2018_I69.chr1.g2976.t1.cds n=1 Tax=Oikopleura dioica TaxID=34765 RepID=A0ABN7SZ63_OIKDI|nr:Oidioi.mRNA.OKI2018_I69.chr1.g2976.t1.cds [Oikopleura dioica]